MPDYRRRATREAMTIGLDVNGMMSEVIGTEGLTDEEVMALEPRVQAAHHEILRHTGAGKGTAPASVGEELRPDLLKPVLTLAATIREEFETLVVCGTAASTLGTRALVAALAEDAAAVVFVDHVDPWRLTQLLDGLDLQRTAFNFVSRSGDTAETVAQFLIVRDLLLRALGAVDYKRHVIVTTDQRQGALRQIVNDEGFRDVPVLAAETRRPSPLSPAAAFPAAFAGVHVENVLAGASWMDELCSSTDLWGNRAYLLGVLLQLAGVRRTCRVVAALPFSERLECLAEWFVQLWGEGLNRACDADGRPLASAQLPYVASGYARPLQSVLEGPREQIVLLLRVEDHGREIEIPRAYGDLEGVGYLSGLRLGALIDAEQRVVEIALARRGRMSMTVTVPQINAFTVGQLARLFELATRIVGGLNRIDPFRQPASEEGKELTFALTGRKGWEGQEAEVQAWLSGKRKPYIL